MLSKGLEKVVSNILDVKQSNEVLRYLYNDTQFLVATDTRRMLILDTVLTDVECLIMIKKVASCCFTPTVIVSGYPAITETFRYPDYKRIIISEQNSTVLYIEYTNDNVNELICFIAKQGITFDVKFIQDLFVNKINLNITKLVYNKDNMANPFMLEGIIEGYPFKYIVMPIKI